MKLLFFAACESMRAARALSAQTHESLNPYIKYLNSAKKGAARRQELSRCGWEMVAADRSISLRPLDSLVELTTDDIVYVVRVAAATPTSTCRSSAEPSSGRFCRDACSCVTALREAARERGQLLDGPSLRGGIGIPIMA